IVFWTVAEVVVWPFVTTRERARREAADWFAKLRGPRREEHRPEFTSWYHSRPENREAFDRVSSIWDAAAGLQPAKEPLVAGSRWHMGRSPSLSMPAMRGSPHTARYSMSSFRIARRK